MNLRKIFKKSKVDISCYLDLLFLFSESVSMIQVGANDGKLCDPVRKFVLLNKVNGIMLEPQADVFNRLKQNYENVQGINFVNKALSSESSTTYLYSVDDELVSQYKDLGGVASFSVEHVEKEIKSNLKRLNLSNGKKAADYILKSEVDTVTYSELLDTFSLDSLDLLMIDAEGFDYESVMLFPLDKIKPKAILFEYKHMKKKQLVELEQYLQGHGYKHYYARNDVLFVQA